MDQLHGQRHSQHHHPGVCGDALAGTNDNCAAGIDLQTVSGVSLTGVHVSGGAQIGINGKNVTGLTLTGVEVNNAGNEAKEDGIQIHNLFGSATWAGLNVHDNAAAQVEIQNAGSAPVNLTMTSPQFTAASFQSFVTGAQGLLFSGSGSADMTLGVTNATFARSFAAAFETERYWQRDRHCRARWRHDERRRKLPEDRQHEQREPDVLDDGIHRVGRSGAHERHTDRGAQRERNRHAHRCHLEQHVRRFRPDRIGGPVFLLPDCARANGGTGATQNLLVSENTMHHSRNVSSG